MAAASGDVGCQARPGMARVAGLDDSRERPAMVTSFHRNQPMLYVKRESASSLPNEHYEVTMAARRRIQPDVGRAALDTWHDAARSSQELELPKAVVATAVRYGLEELANRAPGRAVEVRVAPFGAVQVLEGTRHTRGTPPGVVQMDPATFLALVTGRLAWDQGVAQGLVKASGHRADLSGHLPL
jgi:hypothetical protein